MKYDFGLEKQLLELLEANDHGSGVRFSEKQKNLKQKWRDDVRREIEGNAELTPEKEYHFNQMEQLGLVRFAQNTDIRTIVCITPYGHARLEEIRHNTWARRLLRVIGGWLDKAMTSIILPIVVSILTVLALGYLGLDGP